jgi:hypothetical protein
MELSEILKGGAAIAAIVGTLLAIYLHIRNRGRLRVNAWLINERGSAMPDEPDRRFLAIEAVNAGQENVVLKYFGYEFRLRISKGWFGISWIEINLLNANDLVTIEPGHHHIMRVPLDPDQILTSVSATTSLGRKYEISRLRLWALRRQQRQIRRLQQRPIIPSTPQSN